MNDFSRKGIGLLGIYYKSKKRKKGRVVLSPPECDVKKLSDNYPLDEYDPCFILLAEDPNVVESLK